MNVEALEVPATCARCPAQLSCIRGAANGNRVVDRVGEQSAVACHCEYVTPLSASFWSVGMSMRPPKGDHDANPVSSKRTIWTKASPARKFLRPSDPLEPVTS